MRQDQLNRPLLEVPSDPISLAAWLAILWVVLRNAGRQVENLSAANQDGKEELLDVFILLKIKT